jgi:multisubunit Na+/H+ antiporter MnhG subunit
VTAGAAHVLALVLVSLGCAVIVLAAVGAAVMPGGVFNRLHFLTPVTSVGLPLVVAGLCVESGQPFTIAELVVIGLVVAVEGPVLESATGRAAAAEQGLAAAEEPE